MHPFETPPARVLDLGCGSGAWIMQAAEGWPVRSYLLLPCALSDNIV